MYWTPTPPPPAPPMLPPRRAVVPVPGVEHAPAVLLRLRPRDDPLLPGCHDLVVCDDSRCVRVANVAFCADASGRDLLHLVSLPENEA